MSDNYPLTTEQRDSKNKAFVDSIDQDSICALASRHNHSEPCRVFGTASGSFNICFFVEFLGDDDKTRWAVRIPIEPVIADVWAKLQSEVATMRYIQRNTTIPLPGIHAYGRGERLTSDGYTTQSYLILGFIPGQPLDGRALTKDTKPRREHFYSQLIDVLAQLRQLEFPAAGSLMPDPHGRPDPVVGNLLSIPMNELQVIGRETPASSTFKSATGFALHQHAIMSQACRYPSSELPLGTAQLELFALDHLETQIPELLSHQWDAGPFVLSHTDLRCGNIMVDDDLNIKAILDWEWACTVPRQLFVPPPWITGQDLNYQRNSVETFREFHQLLEAKATASKPHRQLADEWTADLLSDLTLPLVRILQHHSSLIRVYSKFIYPRFFTAPRRKGVPQFFEEDSPKNRMLALEARRRVDNSERYTQYLKDNGLFVVDEEARRVEEWLQKARELNKRLGLSFEI